MQLPANISAFNVQSAIDSIRKRNHQVPPSRQSRKYVVRQNGKDYPPKYLICLANTFSNRLMLPPNTFHGGPQANNFLISRGFDLFDTSVIPNRKVNLEAVEEDPAMIFPEGRQRELFRLHVQIERNPRLAREVKNRRILQCGNLSCDACGFSFPAVYGDLGIGFIEAHHILPLSALRGPRKTKLEDIALLCANCHRMIHRCGPDLPPIEEFKCRLKKLN